MPASGLLLAEAAQFFVCSFTALKILGKCADKSFSFEITKCRTERAINVSLRTRSSGLVPISERNLYLLFLAPMVSYFANRAQARGTGFSNYEVSECSRSKGQDV